MPDKTALDYGVANNILLSLNYTLSNFHSVTRTGISYSLLSCHTSTLTHALVTCITLNKNISHVLMVFHLYSLHTPPPQHTHTYSLCVHTHKQIHWADARTHKQTHRVGCGLLAVQLAVQL